MPAPAIIQTDRLSMHFPAVRALHQVSLSFHPGQVHGMIGENGAGKSTLMRILSGLQKPTSGRILIDNIEQPIPSPAQAARLGIVMIHQELNLVDDLSVAANLFLGREKTRLGLIDARATNADARNALARIGANDIPPAARVGDLSIAQQQIVEIAKAVSQNARLLIMDEPTAVLTSTESAKLFDLIRQLRQQGVSIIYISHLLPEVIALCDRITILRDGEVVKTVGSEETEDGRRKSKFGDSPTSDFRLPSSYPSSHSSLIAHHSSPPTEAELAGLMVGRPMADHFPPRAEPKGDVIFRVENVSVSNRVHDASFEVRAGEIFGLAGLIGAGRTELAEALVGLRPRSAGRMWMDNHPIAPKSLRQAVQLGMAYLSEDRKSAGLTLSMNVIENTTLASLRRYSHLLINHRAEQRATREHVERLRIRVGDLRDPVRLLSGGNQQKVLLAKWLEIHPKLLIIDEPTRGVDIGAKEEIYRLIRSLTDAGMACILISSEMNELLGLANRIAILRQGKLIAALDAAVATEQTIMRHAAGIQEELATDGAQICTD